MTINLSDFGITRNAVCLKPAITGGLFDRVGRRLIEDPARLNISALQRLTSGLKHRFILVIDAQSPLNTEPQAEPRKLLQAVTHVITGDHVYVIGDDPDETDPTPVQLVSWAPNPAPTSWRHRGAVAQLLGTHPIDSATAG
jgi:hypothetical protein